MPMFPIRPVGFQNYDKPEKFNHKAALIHRLGAQTPFCYSD